jgi:hypothetical protein
VPGLGLGTPWLFAIILAYVIYGAGFIWRSSFVVHDTRYFVLFDDAMVSMRYARHLADGQGLVWNAGGPRVEGFSNPLWVGYMALVHRLPVSTAKVSSLIQATGLLLMVLILVTTAQLAAHLSHGSRLAAGAAVLLTAFSLSLNTWALGGMEVSALGALILLAAWLAVRDPVHPSIWSLALLGLGTWIRIDVIVPLIVMVAWAAWFDRERRSRLLLVGTGLALTMLGLQTALRWWYYGELLPNTYYLKVAGYPPGLRIGHGILALLYHLQHLALGMLPVLPALLFLRWDRRLGLVVLLLAGQVAYSVYVGGDAWDWTGLTNRYLSIVLPLGFVLVGIGLHRWRTRWLTSDPSPASLRRTVAIAIALVLLAVCGLNQQAAPEVARSWLLRAPLLHGDHAPTSIRTAAWFKECADSNATIAVVWAGTLPYFAEHPAIDLLGKADAVIARQPMRRPPASAPLLARLAFFYPGHLKWDYAYSIGQQRPDMVVGLWPPGPDGPRAAGAFLAPYVEATIPGDTAHVYLRKASPRLHCEVAGTGSSIREGATQSGETRPRVARYRLPA